MTVAGAKAMDVIIFLFEKVKLDLIMGYILVIACDFKHDKAGPVLHPMRKHRFMDFSAILNFLYTCTLKSSNEAVLASTFRWRRFTS